MAFNTYPENIFALPAYLKYGSVNRDLTDAVNLFIADAIDIDFRVESILGESDVAEKVAGYKYIIGATPVLEATQTLLARSGITEGDVNIGDIIVFNPTKYDADGSTAQEERFERLFNAGNVGFGASGGAIVYVKDEQSFKGYDGDDWKPLGGGVTGGTGHTGETGVFGRKYTQKGTFVSVSSAGDIRIDNDLDGSIRDFKIHKGSLSDANADLTKVFLPRGNDSSNDDINPAVTTFFFNKTNSKLFGVRLKAKGASNTDDSNILDFTDPDHFSDYEILVSDSGAGSWDPTWDSGDEIFVLSVADGIIGATGETGATGQGITFGGISANADGLDELLLRYLDADGNITGATVETGILSGVDGITGAPGEVGLEMFFTGGTDKWESRAAGLAEGEGLTAMPGFVKAAGDFIYSKDTVISELDGVTQDCVISSIRSKDFGTDFVWRAAGLDANDISPGGRARDKFTNKPGKIYFYTNESDYEIKLRSFIGYEKVAFADGDTTNAVVFGGVTYGDFTTNLLGADGTTAENGYIVVAPNGVRGTGITFGEVVDNKLFLDYIDEDGNTFGRFESISGISGDQGQMNPFNIMYSITADSVDYSGLTASGHISVSQRESGATSPPTKLKVSSISSSGDNVHQYISLTTNETQTKSGFITVFSETDVADFGLYRFTNAVNDGNSAGVEFQDLVHAGGNNTLIRGSGAEGFDVGENIKLAINLDGKRGFSGEIVGYTFGIEYFSQSVRPTLRTNGDVLEIGDKWFSHTTGLEFTFLGSSGDTDSVIGHGTSADPVWVQTNNARSGPRGPKGEAGSDGETGPAGATGLNPSFGSWTNRAYQTRQAVYVDFNTAYEAISDSAYGLSVSEIADAQANMVANWSELGLDGATAGYFVIYANGVSVNDIKNIPGTHAHVSGSWDSFGTSKWAPVIAANSGPSGDDGARGITGSSVTNAILNGDTLEIEITDFDDANPDGTPRDVVVGNVRGPQGDEGPVGGQNNEYIYNDSSTAAGSRHLRNVKFSGDTQVRIGSYSEEIFYGADTPDVDSGSWSIECGPGALGVYNSTQEIQLPNSAANRTISSVTLNNIYSNGGAVTIILHGPTTRNEAWKFGAADKASNVTFTFDGVNPGDPDTVFISIQNESTTNPTLIDLPKDSNEVGVFTFRRSGGDPGPLGDSLFVNYVKYQKPVT